MLGSGLVYYVGSLLLSRVSIMCRRISSTSSALLTPSRGASSSTTVNAWGLTFAKSARLSTPEPRARLLIAMGRTIALDPDRVGDGLAPPRVAQLAQLKLVSVAPEISARYASS